MERKQREEAEKGGQAKQEKVKDSINTTVDHRGEGSKSGRPSKTATHSAGVSDTQVNKMISEKGSVVKK